MQHEIITTISISASPERVWEVLMDFARYPEWNPFVRSIEGSPTEGSVLQVRIEPPGGKAMTFRPVVLRRSEGREFPSTTAIRMSSTPPLRSFHEKAVKLFLKFISDFPGGGGIVLPSGLGILVHVLIRCLRQRVERCYLVLEVSC
jgi:hypothetical protein